MNSIGPGTLVKCVDDGPDYRGRPQPLTNGKVYTVNRVIKMKDRNGNFGIILEEVKTPPPYIYPNDTAFSSSRFVPIDESEIDLFRELVKCRELV